MADDVQAQRSGGAVEYRRINVPSRVVGDAVILARPSDGVPVLLPATAACVWSELARWVAAEQLDHLVEVKNPTIPADERHGTVRQILRQMQDEGLLERR